MKQICGIVLLLLLEAAPLLAQTRTLADFNRDRLAHTRNSMLVLGTWATANIAVGAIGMSRSQGEQRAFHQMNLGWGVVNLGLAASGWWTATHSDPAAFDLYNTTLQHHKLQKIFLFNAGLDVGYMTAGFWLQERAKTTVKRPERLRGFGKSLVLQGAFLFAFDVGAVIYHQQLEKDLKPFLQNTSLGFDGQSVGLVWRF